MKTTKIHATKLGCLTATQYQLATGNQGKIAITHIPSATNSKTKAHIVCNPGMFSNRRFWLSDKGIGLAAYLSEQGYACWILDRRGMGASEPCPASTHSLFNTIECDLPAVQQLLASKGVNSAFYMGHSFGGVMNSLSVARGCLNPCGVAGLINVSSQLTVGKRFLNKPYSSVIYGVTGLLNHFPSRLLKMGPENESKQAMRDACKLVSLAKNKRTKDTFWHDISTIECPVLGIGSKGDTVDPAKGCEALVMAMGAKDKTFVTLAKQNGFKQDYDHVGMLVSKDAQSEVWPLISGWLGEKYQAFSG